MSRPTMTPSAGERMQRFVGDRVRFTLEWPEAPAGTVARLRTSLGRAKADRAAVIATLGGGRTFAGLAWRDIPLIPDGPGRWSLDMPLTEAGWFRAKPFCLLPNHAQAWPAGDDIGLSVHPDCLRSGNTIYCAFVRMFGATKTLCATRNALLDEQMTVLDKHGWTAIPPSGTFRDLTAQLDHIAGNLGCRILHLLPVTSTPTTYARYGRFGSPYASQDLTAIDPALVVFDKKTTAVDQFRELTYAAHLRSMRVILDIVVNHTGWGSRLQERHPEWFKRQADGTFHSPGAWGNTWEDLVELDNRFPALWEQFAEALLTWCRRGVDGFRCDAGYMVPLPAWQYITARVTAEFPDTVFLLEGLGGSWDATASLLGEGGMQWAYSELFQNYDGRQVQSYLDHCITMSPKVGALVHYSETHDNDRLAKRGRAWSLLRNRLAALTSQGGAFGFTCGVEWLATEKLEVHQSRGLNWGASGHIVEELGHLSRLVTDHPCFLDEAVLERLSPDGDPVLAIRRTSAEGLDQVLVLINTDMDAAHDITLPTLHLLGGPTGTSLQSTLGLVDLLGQALPAPALSNDGAGNSQATFRLAAGGAWCLAATPAPRGLGGDHYRSARAQAAWAYDCLHQVVADEDLGPCEWRALAGWVAADPVRFLASLPALDPAGARAGLMPALLNASAKADLPAVVRWSLADLGRVVPVPPKHWLLVRDTSPFAASLSAHSDQAVRSTGAPRHARSLLVNEGYIACFPPVDEAGDAVLLLERFDYHGRQVAGQVRFLRTVPDPRPRAPQDGMALLTNGRGGMARLAVDLGKIHSKYDCLLGANLHPTAPSDRHFLAKRLRVWVNADGFISPLDASNLAVFTPGPPARWTFVAAAGDGHAVNLELEADMPDGKNATVLRFRRPADAPVWGTALPAGCTVLLIVRVDIEDRSFHSETRRSPGSERHFGNNCHPLEGRPGFIFAPAPERTLRTYLADGGDHGRYTHEGEWCEGIPHPVEASRGMANSGDAYSPGWFELTLAPGAGSTLVVAVAGDEPTDAELSAPDAHAQRLDAAITRAQVGSDDGFGRDLAAGLQAYVVRRGAGRTVIAGYPWFLDWGRDTFIAARGMLAAGMHDEVRQLLATFGRFEENGTLPNLLNGDEAANRDTSDAQLWYALACEELAAIVGDDLYKTPVVGGGRTLGDVLRALATGYLTGTPNGIRVDPASALVWSPPHFTWMDTNYPAASPRTGYPLEIQVLWIRLLRQLERIRSPATTEPWWALADRAEAGLAQYWLEDRGYFGDCLHAANGEPAAKAVLDNALRPNQLFAVSLGVVTGERAKRCVAACLRYLVVPGAIRSLAPLAVAPPLPVYGADGKILNDPDHPYWGRYEGDEDTQRKPAYHNGTAWTWPFPVFCEALAMAWGRSPGALETARAYLGSMDLLLAEGCIGHIPELLDGNAPHQQRGCDAQAWGISEALRVWKVLGRGA